MDNTLDSLVNTLNRIYLQAHSIKRYELSEKECRMAAEPALMYSSIAGGSSFSTLEKESSKQ